VGILIKQKCISLGYKVFQTITMVKLFIGGFPLDMTELEIVQRVALYADVQTIKIVRDKKTKICKGYAFLEVTDRAGAEQAMDALNGTQIAGRELMLNIVEEDQPKKPAGRPKFTPKTTFNKRPRLQRN
jgi:RNA recognition motif-containing protein